MLGRKERARKLEARKAEAVEARVRRRALLSALRTNVIRLAPEGAEVVEGVFGFESFYRPNGSLVQIVRYEASADASILHQQHWFEITLRQAVLSGRDHEPTRYFIDTSFYYDQIAGDLKVEKRYTLHRGVKKGAKFLDNALGDERATPKFFEPPNYYVERAEKRPKISAVYDALKGLGLVCRPNGGIVEIGLSESPPHSAIGTSMQELTRVNAMLNRIDPERDRIKFG